MSDGDDFEKAAEKAKGPSGGPEIKIKDGTIVKTYADPRFGNYRTYTVPRGKVQRRKKTK